MINLKINNKPVSVPEGSTILEAASQLNIHIPTLCHMDMHNMRFVNQVSSCRVCMVEQAGRDKMLAACSTKVWEGLEVRTDTLKVLRARRTNIELLLSNHPADCLVCEKNGNCELQSLAAQTGIRSIRYPGQRAHHAKDNSSLSLIRNPDKCILCKRCETMCNDVQTVGALTDIGRGFNTVVGTLFDMPMLETTCTFCGQCLAVCPTAALTEVDNTGKVWEALASHKTVVVQTAPAVRVALGEMFGLQAGTDVTGKMVSALKAMGFDRVYDTNFAADVTIMEEASEMVARIKKGGRLPILTSCCPGWVKFLEHQFGDMLDIPSTAKSPHEIFGSLAKTYLAQKMELDPHNIVVVSVMPCVAKKYESARPELSQDGLSDVDIVITTRELGNMIQDLGLDFANLADADFDRLMGEASGAGDIFGASGGVIEAALRTAYVWLTGHELKNLDFYALRGLSGIKEATVDVDGKPIRIACANGLGNARELLRRIRKGEADYTAIEIMACPGGCIAGGGQPYTHGDEQIIQARMQSIYERDRGKQIRQSHKNPEVMKLYEDFLGEPGGPKAHALLHTHYVWRQKM
ncbi:MAG: NADH-dependent [FeFe] hydrogenase, group A6 [Oscillospiraceae bacterium]|nr:NADH-dependent [FeFe] hydrogenase, group A6 [Oscillospiraceae bacterium]MDD4368814.1 NADH-dependent [FeFe] hydrogenase, group A6 [Oscillospiraceae bacterium]